MTQALTPEHIATLPYRKNVGIMMTNADGHVFVGQRRDNRMAAWQMPQGGIDKGEKPETAALRELEEETGVSSGLVTIVAESQSWIRYELPHDLIPKLWGGKWRGQEQRWFLMRFDGTDADINIATEHPEFSEWRWLPPEQLVANIVPFKQSVYEAVLAEFTPHL